MLGRSELNYPGAYWLADRGKYYRFTPKDVLVIRPWPLPQAWFKENQGAWGSAAPSVDFQEAHRYREQLDGVSDVVQLNRVQRMTPFGAALHQVPPKVLAAAQSAHMINHSWKSLALQGRCPGTLELAQNASLLCGLLSIGNIVRPIPIRQPLRAARALLKQPDGWKRWANICRWLDLDDSKAFTRMTRKNVSTEEPYCWPNVRAMINLWNCRPGKKLLQHLPEINGNVRRLFNAALTVLPAEEAARVLHPQFLEEHAQQTRWGGTTGALIDTLFLWEDAWGGRSVPVFRSIEQIETLRAETVDQARLNANNGQDPLTLPFPSAPLRGRSGIVPLDSDEKLKAESAELSHCIGNGQWAKLSRLRQGFAYSVFFQGERATLWISRSRKEKLGFEIEQVKGPKNSRVSTTTLNFINRWMQHHTAWIRHHSSDAPRPKSQELPPVSDDWQKPLVRFSASRYWLYEEDIPF